MRIFLSRLLLATALIASLALAGCQLPSTSDTAPSNAPTDADATVEAAVEATVQAITIEAAVQATLDAAGGGDAEAVAVVTAEPAEEATVEPAEEATVGPTTEPTVQSIVVDQASLTPTAGGEFNQFFPQVASPLDLVYAQEKEGFAQAELSDDGEEVATLSVSDTATNPSARDKFVDSDLEIAGYPAAAVGSQGTALLIAGRYQVQVRSRVDSFTADDRSEWLSRFDLEGLASLP